MGHARIIPHVYAALLERAGQRRKRQIPHDGKGRQLPPDGLKGRAPFRRSQKKNGDQSKPLTQAGRQGNIALRRPAFGGRAAPRLNGNQGKAGKTQSAERLAAGLPVGLGRK